MSEHRTASFQLLVNIQSYSDQELKGLADDLQGQERDISKQRRLIHAKLDILRAEMVRRLRDKYGSGETLFEAAMSTSSAPSLLAVKHQPTRHQRNQRNQRRKYKRKNSGSLAEEAEWGRASQEWLR